MGNDVLKRIVMPTVFAVMSLLLTSCDSGQDHGLDEAMESPAAAPTVEPASAQTLTAATPTAEPEVAPTPEKVPVTSEATVPRLSLIYKGETFEGYRFRGCWQGDDGSGTQCVDTTPWDAVDTYIEVAPGDTITIRIDPDSRPTKLLASFYTEPGELSVDSLIRISPGERELVIDQTPGRYNLRINAQWFEGGARPDHKASYVFGLSIPGEAELRYGCGQTLQGGIMGIVIGSLEEPNRTAIDAVNGGWCTFNKEIAQIRLILESEDIEAFVETFHFKPPSLVVHLPIPENVASERTVQELPPGEYSRRIVAITVDGESQELRLRNLPVIKLADETPPTGAPIVFPQHQETRPAFTGGVVPEYEEGGISVRNGCIYIGNGEIPVWPPDFSVDERDGRLEILDEKGSVAAREGRNAILRGRMVRVDDPEGREIGRTLPFHCPPGNYWMVTD